MEEEKNTHDNAQIEYYYKLVNSLNSKIKDLEIQKVH
jgi:hypothetical protein